MRRAIVLINKNHFIYNDEKYDFDRVDTIKHFNKINLKIIILAENLYIKQFEKNIKRRNINDFIYYKIKNDFPQTGDLLYDYEVTKNCIAIYSIKGGIRLQKIIERASSLDVKPIQFIIKEIMLKHIKKNDFKANVLTKFDKCYYFISFNEGLFNLGLVDENEESILRVIHENNNGEDIYMDDYIADNLSEDFIYKEKIKIIKLNIGELVNEKIYKKQKFHSRKIS